MFTEPQNAQKTGWIEVICGSMFSGKSEELIRRLKRVEIAGKQARIFKPETDTRYDKEHIVSHDASRIPCLPVASPESIPALAVGVDVVGIDEAQFFDDSICDIADHLAQAGVRVIVAGLDMDFTGKPFGPVPALMARAEYVTKLHAICAKCGSLANYSYRKSQEQELFLLGERDLYEPRCRTCYGQ
ncbi:MAG: thymidine kinase [Taibaiella sp.]|nr:thymidine kinase [Taibaiella sp.]